MTMINRNEGVIDKNNLRFEDVLSIKAVSNVNFQEGLCPHIWENAQKIDWYVAWFDKAAVYSWNEYIQIAVDV